MARLVHATQTDAYSGPGSFLEQVEKGEVRKVIQQGETLSVFLNASPANATEPDYTVTVANVLTQVSQDIAAAAAKGGKPQPVFDPKLAPDNSLDRARAHGVAAADLLWRLLLLHDAPGPGQQ